MTPARIEAQVAELKQQGCDGAVISPRQGYPGAYLGPDWFDSLRMACETLAAAGLAPSLADEFPYPSGQAGGLVTLGHPEWGATALKQEVWETRAGQFRRDLPAGAVLNITAVPLTSRSRPDWSQAIDLSGAVGVRYTLDTFRETERDLSAYNGRRSFAAEPVPVIDTVLPAGWWRVIASVQIAQRGHKYVGTGADTLDAEAMNAFFRLTHDRLARQLGEPVGRTLAALFVDEIQAASWSRHLPGLWREATGEDLLPHLPALICDDFPGAEEMRAKMDDLRLRRFQEVFLGPLRDWCRHQEVTLVEERPLTRLSETAAVDIPGGDPGHVRVGAKRHDLLGGRHRHNIRATVSAAFWYNKQGALCEVAHSLGWGATLEDLRWLCDNLLLHGITHVLPHAAFASTAGLRKHDAPPSWFFQQSWWPYHHLLAERIRKLNHWLSNTRPEIDLLIIDPTPHGATRADLDALEDLQHRLMAERHEFLLVDTDILERGELVNGAWRFRGLSVTTIILPPHPAPRKELPALLQKLETAGIRIMDEKIEALPPANTEWHVEGEASGQAHATFRTRSDGRKLSFWVNNARQPVTIYPPPGWRPETLPGDLLPAHDAGGWEVSPAQALLWTADATVPPPEVSIVKVEWPEAWAVTRDRENLYLMNQWEVHLQCDSPTAFDAKFTSSHFPLQEQLLRADLPAPAVLKPGFGTPTRLHLAPIRCHYRHAFRVVTPIPLDLIVEDGALVGEDWTLTLNATHLFRPSDFTRSSAADDLSRLHFSSNLLQHGENLLELSCVTQRVEGGLANPLYLAGAFSVSAEGCLAEPITEAPLGDLESAGLRHFAGIILWSGVIQLPETLEPNSERRLCLDHLGPDPHTIQFGAGPEIPVLWSPRSVRLPGDIRPGEAMEVTIRQCVPLAHSFHNESWDPVRHCVVKNRSA